jgi:hypothetical protein
MAAEKALLTVQIPSDLLAATDRAVSAGHARTREELVITALRHELDALARDRRARSAAIDAEFARMADDAASQSEALLLDREFSGASWEAFREAEET